MLSIFKKSSSFFALGLLVLAIFLPSYTKLQELRERNRSLEVRIKKLYKENFLLQEELKLIQDDALYQEKIARERMGIVRKGEIPIKIIPQKD